MRLGRKQRRISRVLVVEDEPLVAFDTEYFLAGEGFDVIATVDTVAEALAWLDNDPLPHLVLADVNLSDGSGIEVARAAHARDIHVLFVTGSCPGDARALAAGCLSKPYPQRDLVLAIDAVEAMLGGKMPRKLPGSFSLFRQPV